MGGNRGFQGYLEPVLSPIPSPIFCQNVSFSRFAKPFIMDIHITTICRKDKLNKRNEAPLALKVTQNNQSKKVSLGIMINPADWDEIHGTLREGVYHREQILFVIESAIQKLKQKILTYQIQEKDFTLDDLIESNKKQKAITVENYFTQYNERIKTQNRLNTLNKYEYCLSSLTKFHSMNIPFTAIDINFLEDFETHLRSKGLSDNSIATIFSCFRCVYLSALDKKLFTCEENTPFSKFQVGKLWTPTQKRAIQKTDIQRLKELDLSSLSKYPTPYLEFARDIFLFSYYTAGINFKDIATLTLGEIDNGYLYYTRHKTKKHFTIKLLPEALSILNKYTRPNMELEDYVFPILQRDIHVTALQQHNRILKVRKKINDNLKFIGQALQTRLKLTTYVARHTFASVLRKSGVDIGIISESLGHSKLSTTQIYLDNFEKEEVDAAMQNLL